MHVCLKVFLSIPCDNTVPYKGYAVHCCVAWAYWSSYSRIYAELKLKLEDLQLLK